MRYMPKNLFKLILGILFLTSLAGCGSGGGGSSSGGSTTGGGSSSGGSGTASLEIKLPIREPSVVLGGEQTTLTISAFVPGSSVELYRVDGDNITKIGDMTDDGKNGDHVAGDHVYTIQTTINESTVDTITYRISASGNNQQVTRDISVSVANIPSFASDSELNQAVDDLYAKSLETKNLLVNFKNSSNFNPTIYQDTGNNLLDMFKNFEAITKQDIGITNLFGSSPFSVGKFASF